MFGWNALLFSFESHAKSVHTFRNWKVSVYARTSSEGIRLESRIACRTSFILLLLSSMPPWSDRAQTSDTSSMNRYYHCHDFKFRILVASKNEKPVPVSTFLQSIDDPTIKMLMQYFKIGDYDCFVRFAQKSGIKRAVKRYAPQWWNTTPHMN